MADQVHLFPPAALAVTFTAGGTIAAGNVVAVSASRTVVTTSGPSAAAIGTAASDAASGEKVAVLLGGVQRCVAAGAITAGALVTSAASGRVATIGAGTFDQVFGQALTSAAQAGDVIEVRVTK